ncbi:MAG: hypothetical protein AUJ04_06465 [Acidobacteria bacterium 13_1_40CM_3_55_6]|nr:MAG: hypothetical protein AUJ04_06465 [Acidobacteria bacterium 13_1_40CM_3_55_6]PYS64747.1 MAG: hypothetical protein DMF74_05980 [Acidobacteriota bacterium]
MNPVAFVKNAMLVGTMKRGKLFKATLLLAVSTAFSVVLLDGLLWLVHPLPSGHSAQWITKTDIPGVKQQIRFEKYQDLRGRSWTQESQLRKPPGTLRILVVGASTTESPAQESKDAWWGVLEEKLQQQPELAGSSVQVLAFGQGGFEVSDIVMWLKSELPELSPDLLVTLVGINDLTWPEHSDSDLHISYRLRGFLRTVSQIYRHLSAIKLKRDLGRGAAIRWSSTKELKEAAERFRALPLREPATRNPDPLPRFLAGVQSIISLARRNGIPILLLGQPVLWKEEMTEAEDSVRWFSPYEGKVAFRASGDWLYREMQRFNNAQNKAAAEAGSCFLKLDQVIPKSLEMFYDDCHFTDAGSIKVAEAVLPAVVECLRRN